MSGDGDLQQAVLQKTLQEVAHDGDGNLANPCVICLDIVREPCVALPCSHTNFDFLCLASWLELRASCPLCKSDVTSVKYDVGSQGISKIYHLPPTSEAPPLVPPSIRRSQLRQRRHPYLQRRAQPPQLAEPDDALLRRRHVYRHQLYSLRVGSNRLSRYRELSPAHFNHDEELVSRARKWIRRELKVFSFLYPSSNEEFGYRRAAQPSERRADSRRANNAEFLLEYIIAILRTVDIKGSAGQAEELLRDFLGRENASLFLHELQAWLRSPYTSLADWDRNVQYENITRRPRAGGNQSELEERPNRSPAYSYRGHIRRSDTRVSKPYAPKRGRQAYPGEVAQQPRGPPRAWDRYIPD